MGDVYQVADHYPTPYVVSYAVRVGVTVITVGLAFASPHAFQKRRGRSLTNRLTNDVRGDSVSQITRPTKDQRITNSMQRNKLRCSCKLKEDQIQ
jgi:hypothetical protein